MHMKSLALLILIALVAAGCSSQPKAPPKPPTKQVFRNIHQAGGTHYRMIVHHGVWYQTFGSSLLVLDTASGAELKRIDFGRVGEIGPAVDLAALDKRLFVVIEDDEVVELSLELPQVPAITRRIDAGMLGMHPRRLSVVDGVAYVSGPGGIVRLDDLQSIYTAQTDVGRVAKSAGGLVTTVGRQVRNISDNTYAGSASELLMLPSEFNMPGAMAFARQGDQGALFGLMSPEVREVDAQRATSAVPGVVRSLRAEHGQIWVVSDLGLTMYTVKPDSIEVAARVEILGCLDAGMVDANNLVLSGTFGRTMYRIDKDDKGPGQTFYASRREASRLSRAVSDGQHILAGSAEGLWLYLINSRVELTTKSFQSAPPSPRKEASTVNAQARISDDRKSVILSMGGTELTYFEADFCEIRCIAEVDGDFWLGHDRGITVLGSTPTAPVVDSKKKSQDQQPAQPGIPLYGSLRLPGPVLYIYPLLVGGGASYVSELGGFGVAKFMDEPLTPPTPHH